MSNSEKMEATLHKYINSIATINSSLQLIEKQHPEVRNFDFWEDVLDDIHSLSDQMYTLTNTSRSGKSDPASEES